MTATTDANHPAPPPPPPGVELVGVLVVNVSAEPPRPEAWARDSRGRLWVAEWNPARGSWGSWRLN